MAINTKQLTVDQVRSTLVETTVETMRAITKDSEQRLEGYKANVQLLGGGVFYPGDYFQALTNANQTDRLDWFKKRHFFLIGYIPKHFDRVKEENNPFVVKIDCFVLKKGVLPSDAIDAAIQGPSMLGCGSVCQIAQYCAIRAVWGKEKFNVCFAADSSTPLMIGSNLPNNPIAKLRIYFTQGNSSAPEKIRKGDAVFIYNVPSYLSKHPIGPALGFNAICAEDATGSRTFVGLGFSSRGITQTETETILLFENNRPFTRFQMLTPEAQEALCRSLGEGKLEKMKELSSHEISLEQLREQGGGRIQRICELYAGLITLVANLTPREARLFLNSKLTPSYS